MKELVISVTQAARRFSDCVNRVRYQGASFLLEKNGVPVARVVPVEATSGAGLERLAVALCEARNEMPEGEKEAAAMFPGHEQTNRIQEPSGPRKRPALNW